MKIVLVNMPFADWNRPSFALSQLSALLNREFGDSVTVDVRYLNIDFARYFGGSTHEAIAGDLGHLLTGLGDWLFRNVAFPDEEDNAEEYFRRYYPGPQNREFREHLLERRDGLRAFCEEIVERYDLATADVVGFTSMFAQTVASLALARVIKDRAPRVLNVLGGANCESPMGSVFAEYVDAVDFVFSGPALHSFPDFVRALRDGNHDGLRDLPGVLSAQNAASAAETMGKDRDIDDFFEPDYSEFVDKFSRHRPELGPDVEPILFFETSRGCWWGQRSHCTFCGLNGLGMGFRSMAPEVALRQFEWLFGHAPWCGEFFGTDNILPRNYTAEVLPRINTPPGASLFWEIKLPVSERDMAVLASSGVRKVQPGIEALSTQTLKLMRKGTSVFQNLQFLRSCVLHRMMPVWNLLTGFPGESEDIYVKYVEDIPLLAHLPPPSGAYPIRFDRYSPYFTDPEKFGLSLRPMDFYALVYPFPTEAIEKIAYFFDDENMSSAMLAAITWLEPINEKIYEWQRQWTSAAPPPRLALERADDGAAQVVDTRHGVNRSFVVDGELELILSVLTSPVKMDTLVRRTGLTPDRVGELVAFLRGRGVLFEEDERLLSLVVREGAVDEPDHELPLIEISNASRQESTRSTL